MLRASAPIGLKSVVNEDAASGNDAPSAARTPDTASRCRSEKTSAVFGRTVIVNVASSYVTSAGIAIFAFGP
jgi:hypothetical protein